MTNRSYPQALLVTDRPYPHPIAQSTTGPLGQGLRRLTRGVDVTLALSYSLGHELATKAIRALSRVKLREVRADDSKIPSAPYVHDENAPHIRRAAIVLVLICQWLGPTGRTGHRAQGSRLRVDVLADRAGVSIREIERYLAVLRQAGILKNWQPPKSSGLPAGISGHCFNLYELVAGIPKALEAHLARFHRAWWPRRATVEIKGAVDAAAIAAAIRARREAPS